MAITASAKKAHRASLKKNIINTRRKRALTTTTKTVKKLISTDVKEAEKNLAAAYQAIDKAAKRGVIKENTASRKKSRLVAMVKRGTKAK